MLLLTHLTLMSCSFLIIATGVFFAMFRRKNPAWLKRHKVLNSSGMVLALSGFFFIVLAISLVQGEHFTILHTWVGLLVIASVLITPLLGQLMFAVGAQIAQVRPWHIWWGRATLALMLLNIILGSTLVL